MNIHISKASFLNYKLLTRDKYKNDNTYSQDTEIVKENLRTPVKIVGAKNPTPYIFL
jgi:hypothetical protein